MNKLIGKIKTLDSDDSQWAAVIEGYFTTKDVDRGNEIVEPTAFTETMPVYMATNPISLFNHNVDAPIGKILSYRIDEVGVYITAGITSATAIARDVAALIKAEIVQQFSFMYKVLDLVRGENGEPDRVTKLELYEVSPVSIAMNPNAVIEQAKSKGINLETITPKDLSLQDGDSKKGVPAMADEGKLLALEKKVNEFLGEAGTLPTALKTYEGKLQEMKTGFDELKEIQKLAKEKLKEFEDDRITVSEYQTYCDNVKSDLKRIMDDLETVKQGSKLVDSQAHWKDWRAMMGAGKFAWLTGDDGRALPTINQKAFHYFQAPVDYKSAPDGEFLKKLRDVYDTCLLTYQYLKGRGRLVNPQSLKSYQLLHDMMEHVDSDFAKAMYSTGTGVGDEWVPTLMSAALQDLFRLQPRLANYIPTFNMPSNPYTWPIKTSGATPYLANEATTDNPSVLHKSNLGTSNLTFTAKTPAVCVPISPELIEDAIVDMVGEIRQEIVYALTEGEENALINGDTTSTHRDTAVVTASDDMARQFMGLRFLAIDLSNTFDTQSASAGVGDGTTAFAAKDIRYVRQLCGKMGKNPKEFLYVTSISVMFYTLSMSEFAKANEFGYVSTWYTGELPVVDGCEMYVTDQLSETLGAAGLGDSASTYKAILGFNKVRGFKKGERRGVTVEFEKNILTQQWNFVATRRSDMQNMQPSTLKPVAYGYKIA